MTDHAVLLAPGPVGPRARASPALIALARSRWDLGDISAIDDLGGSYNLNLRLVTGRGTVVLRVYRPWVTPERLASVRSVREGLRRHGLPVPPLVPSDSGEPAIALGGRLVEVEPWQPDDGGTDRPARWLAAAGSLGALQTALRAIGSPRAFVPPPVHNAPSPPVFDDWLGRTVAAIAAAPATRESGVALDACRVAGQLGAQIRQIPRPALPRQLVHGDYGHENVRFRGDVPSLIVDFDFLGVADRIADLADLAFSPHWMGSFGQTHLAPPGRDWGAVSRLVQRHDATSDQPLTREEIAALPLAMASVPVNWIAAAWLQADPVAAVALVAPELDTAAWLVHHRRELAELWLGGW